MTKIPVDPSDYQTISVRRMMDNLEMELHLMGVLESLKMTPELQSRFSRTITAISKDLDILTARHGFGHIQDTARDQIGSDLSDEGPPFHRG